MIKLMVAGLVALSLVGCAGAIDSGNVGVRIGWDQQVKPTPMGAGFYTKFISDVEEWVGKEIMVELDNMQPKAGDNLSMQELDIEIYYTASVAAAPALKTKYANAHVYHEGYVYPAFNLVKSQSRAAVYDATAEIDSLLIHKNRDALGSAIKEKAQTILDASDPGVFTITKVVVKKADTDPTIEESIQKAIMKDKEFQAKEKDVAIKAQEALANKALTKSLSPEIMRLRELDAMVEACKGGNTCILDFTGGNTKVMPLISTAKR